jgi:hypothetical protein
MIGIFCGPVKDDWEFLDDFIFYHSRIVGTKNIHIIDNESSDPRVLAVYEKYKDRVIKSVRSQIVDKITTLDALYDILN